MICQKSGCIFLMKIQQAEKDAEAIRSDVRGLLGGKGANLAEMTRINVPVPPGFTITTEACNAYLSSKEIFPETMWEQMRAAPPFRGIRQWQEFRRSQESLAGFLSIRSKVFHAGNDGHSAQYRIKRPNCARHDCVDRRRTICV